MGDHVSHGEAATELRGARGGQKFVKVKETYTLDDFEMVAKLGKGAFGDVYLVELAPELNAAPNQKEPLVFAMKVMSKAKIFTEQLIKYAKTERDILALYTECNFLVKLYFAF